MLRLRCSCSAAASHPLNAADKLLFLRCCRRRAQQCQLWSPLLFLVACILQATFSPSCSLQHSQMDAASTEEKLVLEHGEVHACCQA